MNQNYFESKPEFKDISTTLSNIIRTSSDKSFKIHAMARLNVNSLSDLDQRIGELITRQQEPNRNQSMLSDDSFDVLDDHSLLVSKQQKTADLELKCLERKIESCLKTGYYYRKSLKSIL